MDTRLHPTTTPISKIKIFESGLQKLVDDFFTDAYESKEKLDSMVFQIKQINLENMYKDCFPKVCKNCSETYANKNDYSDRTTPLLYSNNEVGLYDRKCGMIEYANCNCGTTLVLVLRRLRNESKFGIQKRSLFERWLDKLSDQFPTVDKTDLSEILRFLYRHV